MNKSISLLLGIFLIGLVSANLIVTDSPLNINTKINEQKNYSVYVQNNYTFDIVDVQFTDLKLKGFTFPENISINSGGTKKIDFSVKTSESFHGQINSKVQFKFLVNLPEEVTNYNLYISNQGIDQQYITVRNGDTITWTNEDSITHKIKSSEFGTIEILPNSTNSYTFNNKGSFSFYDEDFEEFTFFSGTIDVIDRTLSQNVHNPTYDYPLIVNLDSILELTDLTIFNSNLDYTVDNKKSKKGQLEIKNTGQEIAEIISVTADKDWVIIDKSNFNLEVQDTDWAGYSILPYFFSSNETDKNYTITFKIKATNTEEYTQTINVFVPYQEITTNFDSDYEYLVYHDNEFCPRHPCSLFCNPELPECQENYTSQLNGVGSCQMNASENFLYEMQRDVQSVANKLERIANSQTATDDEFGKKITDSVDLANQSLTKSIDTEKKEKNRRQTTAWIIGFCVVGFLVWWIMFTLNKKHEKESHLKGNTRYRGE